MYRRKSTRKQEQEDIFPMKNSEKKRNFVLEYRRIKKTIDDKKM